MYIMVDVETDGPIPGDYSMISLGAVVVARNQVDRKSFKATLKPISNRYQSEALAVSGMTRAQTLTFGEPADKMYEFEQWLKSLNAKKLMFISDNNGFDWQFVNWYFHHFLGNNPFGHSSTNLGSLYKGLVKDSFKNFKHLRKTKHTHDPVDDAMGNVEALVYMYENMGLKIAFE